MREKFPKLAEGDGGTPCGMAPEPKAKEEPSKKKQKRQVRLQVVRSLSKLAQLFVPYMNSSRESVETRRTRRWLLRPS